MLLANRVALLPPRVLYATSLGGMLLCFGIAAVPLVADVPTVTVMTVLLPLAIATMLVNASVVVTMLRSCRVAAAELERCMGSAAPSARRRDPLVRLMDAVGQVDTALEQRTLETERLRQADPLTGLGNRRWLEVVAGHAAVESGDEGLPLTLLLLRVEFLHEINRHHGYDVGDQTLLSCADLLRRQLRRNDCIARVSGNEFAVLLPGLSQDCVDGIVARLRQAIQATPQALLGDASLPVRVGATAWNRDRHLDAVLARAQSDLERQDRGAMPVSPPTVLPTAAAKDADLRLGEMLVR